MSSSQTFGILAPILSGLFSDAEGRALIAAAWKPVQSELKQRGARDVPSVPRSLDEMRVAILSIERQMAASGTSYAIAMAQDAIAASRKTMDRHRILRQVEAIVVFVAAVVLAVCGVLITFSGVLALFSTTITANALTVGAGAVTSGMSILLLKLHKDINDRLDHIVDYDMRIAAVCAAASLGSPLAPAASKSRKKEQ